MRQTAGQTELLRPQRRRQPWLVAFRWGCCLGFIGYFPCTPGTPPSLPPCESIQPYRGLRARGDQLKNAIASCLVIWPKYEIISLSGRQTEGQRGRQQRERWGIERGREGGRGQADRQRRIQLAEARAPRHSRRHAHEAGRACCKRVCVGQQ